MVAPQAHRLFASWRLLYRLTPCTFEPLEKRNPLRFPPGGDRLPHIVRPRTRCERSELLLSLTGHGAESPLAAWLSRSFPRPLALRPAVTGRFALSRESGR